MDHNAPAHPPKEQPVLKRHRMPLTTRQSLTRSIPRLLFGKRGAMIAHSCPSIRGGAWQYPFKQIEPRTIIKMITVYGNPPNVLANLAPLR